MKINNYANPFPFPVQLFPRWSTISCENHNDHSARATNPKTARMPVKPTLAEVEMAPLEPVLLAFAGLAPVVAVVDELEFEARARPLKAAKLLGPDSTALIEKTIPCAQ